MIRGLPISRSYGQEVGKMKNYKHFRSITVLALACLAFAIRAQAGPEYTPNMVVEGSAPGLARLDIQLSSKEWQEPRRFVFEGKGSITGGITLPEKYEAEYSIIAYDEEGRPINGGKGPIPPVAALDKPLNIPLPSPGKDDGLVLTLNRERLAIEVWSTKESPGEIAVHAEVFDAAGNPSKFDPEDLYWQLSDGRYLDLHRGFDPRDIELVPHKGFELARLCSLEPVVTACRLNTQCKAIKVCSDPWLSISAGAIHTCAIKESGAAFCWGENIDGQLGAPTNGTCANGFSSGVKCSTRPLPVTCPAGAPCRFKQISAGVTITVALDVNGDVWWWGRGMPDHHRVEAVLAGSQAKFAQVAAGYAHGCALSTRNEVWCWGTNGYGESGVAPFGQPYGTREVPYYAPVRVMVPLKFRKVVAGGETSCAIGDSSYDVVCWGRDDQKQVSGPNSSVLVNPGTAKFYFQQFGGLTRIEDVSPSGSGTCVALGWSNGVRCWGDHSVRNVAGFGNTTNISAGYNHLCSLVNQQAQCLGTNAWGEVGVGNIMAQNAVVNVNAPPAVFASLHTGGSHTCGITPDGNAFCWGRNFEGQIGNGAVSYTAFTPTQVTTP
jgi:hypothetical protein